MRGVSHPRCPNCRKRIPSQPAKNDRRPPETADREGESALAAATPRKGLHQLQPRRRRRTAIACCCSPTGCARNGVDAMIDQYEQAPPRRLADLVRSANPERRFCRHGLHRNLPAARQRRGGAGGRARRSVGGAPRQAGHLRCRLGEFEICPGTLCRRLARTRASSRSEAPASFASTPTTAMRSSTGC